MNERISHIPRRPPIDVRPLSLTALFLVFLAGTFAIPEPADAWGSRRRNNAEEMREDERREDREEERDRARREWQEHQTEQQERHIRHRERQLDTVIDHHERTGHWGIQEPTPASPAPKRRGGTCIYGEGNKVLYQPTGVDCDRGR